MRSRTAESLAPATMDEPLAASGPADEQKPAAVVRRRMATKRSSQSHGDLLFQQQQQQPRQYMYHDNDALGNAASGKVRHMIAPAPAAAAPAPATRAGARLAHGSGARQEQMVRSATSTAGVAYGSHQQRSQQQQCWPSSRPKNYHHYDYTTDSDLTSSQLASSSNYNNYEQNILLFATEHNGSAASPARSSAFNGATAASQPTDPMRLSNATISNNNNNSSSNHNNNTKPSHHHNHQQHQQQQQPLYGLAHPRTTPTTGKFVSHYPTWRQANSPTFYHQNYSFHVPLSPQQLYPAAASGQRQHQQQSHRLRHGSARSAKFKSRTIAHLPQLGAQPQEERAECDYVDDDDDDDYDDATSHYHHRQRLYAERGQSALPTRQFVLSEGDLLVATPAADSDNPFRPGTELSWEADLMVRLMKRGYPVQELPVLVQSAKQVARQQQAPQEDAPSGRKQAPADRSPLVRRQSISEELNESSKAIWTSSMSRAKSVPRFSATGDHDADSIDRLITSIENEMSDLLHARAESNEPGDSVAAQATGAGHKKQRASVGDGGQQMVLRGKAAKKKKSAQGAGQEQPQQQVAVVAPRRKRSVPTTSSGNQQVSSSGNGSKKTEKDFRKKGQADLIRYPKRGAKCCSIQ